MPDICKHLEAISSCTQNPKDLSLGRMTYVEVSLPFHLPSVFFLYFWHLVSWLIGVHVILIDLVPVWRFSVGFVFGPIIRRGAVHVQASELSSTAQ